MGKFGFWRLRTAVVIVCISAALGGTALADEELIPGGQVVGIQLDIEGVLVTGVSEVETVCGTVSPAADAGIREGDIIVAVNGTAVHCASELMEKVTSSGTKETSITLKRNGRTESLQVFPAAAKSGDIRLGLWLRDGIAGVGTVTFVNPETGAFGALGHGVNDLNTGVLLPVEDGTVCRAQVVDVCRGQVGEPGELVGSFHAADAVGRLGKNTICGIFGEMTGRGYSGGTPLPVAPSAEIRNGRATILSCVSGGTVEEYEVEIARTGIAGGAGRDLMIRVTDEDLLETTGGIVQGMSGSPILQNGKLVGAVTHVLVNDPTKGYGILIENMLEAA